MALVADTPSPTRGVAASTACPAAHRPGAAAQRSFADRLMRRLLRLPVDGPTGTAEGARKAFQTSVMVAAVRCVLMYLVFPFVLPAVGLAKGIGPAVGLVVNGVAMVCIVMSMRRFFGADHPKRWWYAGLGGSVLVLLSVLAIVDVADLIG
jgi:hypothetical protein